MFIDSSMDNINKTMPDISNSIVDGDNDYNEAVKLVNDKYFDESLNKAKSAGDNFNESLNKLKNIPTAYSVDKVVEEIKTLKEEALGEYNMGEYNLDNNIGNSISENYRKDMNEGRCFAYDDAIEIVKQGEIK